MYEDFARIIAEKGLKVSDVAKGTKIRAGVFSDWKAGRYTPKADKMQKIADFLGVSVSELYNGRLVIESNEDKTSALDNSFIKATGQKLAKVEYYMDEEAAQMAQEIFDNHDLRVLFDAARTASADDLKTTYAMLMALKRKENPNDDMS